MKELKLKHPFPAVAGKQTQSYGGSQNFSHSSTVKKCGCGIVAACDLLLYMHRYHPDCNCELFFGLEEDNPLDRNEYNRLIDHLRVYFPLIPPFGINAFLFTAGLNAFFMRHSYPYKAMWGMDGREMWKRIEDMLTQDIPVIISVGPNLPLFWQKHKASMYRGCDIATSKKAASVSAHFMSLTEIDSQWLTVSSWGKKYYMKQKDYADYVRMHSSSIVSNIVYITKK